MNQRLIQPHRVWKLVDDNPGVNYVRQFENGTYATIYKTSVKPSGLSKEPIGLPEERVRARSNSDNALVDSIPIETSPWSSDPDVERLLDDETVWKVVYEVSHAPHYTRQLWCGRYVSVFAPVEIVSSDVDVPWFDDRDRIDYWLEADHIRCIEQPLEESPWREGTYIDRKN